MEGPWRAESNLNDCTITGIPKEKETFLFLLHKIVPKKFARFYSDKFHVKTKSL